MGRSHLRRYQPHLTTASLVTSFAATQGSGRVTFLVQNERAVDRVQTQYRTGEDDWANQTTTQHETRCCCYGLTVRCCCGMQNGSWYCCCSSPRRAKRETNRSLAT